MANLNIVVCWTKDDLGAGFVLLFCRTDNLIIMEMDIFQKLFQFPVTSLGEQQEELPGKLIKCQDCRGHLKVENGYLIASLDSHLHPANFP